MTRSPPPRAVAVVMIAAHVLSMAGFASYAAVLPELRDLWRLSNAEAGLVGGLFFVGYVATVACASALTDRMDPRRIYVAGSLFGLAGCAGFGLFAEGFASAVLFQALAGAGIGTTYMPGLRILSDRSSGAAQSRYIAFYTSFFGIGMALSYAIAGFAAAAWGWRAAFLVSSAGPLASGLLVFLLIPPEARAARGLAGFTLAAVLPLGAWRRVLSDRVAAGFTLGYVVHCFELFASRQWMVAFLAFAALGHAPGAGFPWSAAAIAAVVNLLAVPASVLGNEAALRVGRRRWVLAMMLGSGACGLAMAAAASLPWALLVGLVALHTVLVMGDSATLTAGFVAAAPAELRGAAMGLYSLAGFGGGMLGPVAFGLALDMAGGATSASAWIWAYLVCGAGCLAAPLVARGRSGRP